MFDYNENELNYEMENLNDLFGLNYNVSRETSDNEMGVNDYE